MDRKQVLQAALQQYIDTERHRRYGSTYDDDENRSSAMYGFNTELARELLREVEAWHPQALFQ